MQGILVAVTIVSFVNTILVMYLWVRVQTLRVWQKRLWTRALGSQKRRPAQSQRPYQNYQS